MSTNSTIWAPVEGGDCSGIGPGGQARPGNCLGFVLRGIFLGRPRELDWFLYGLKTVFPEAWRKLVEPLTDAERGDILHSFHRRLLDPDKSVHLPAARAWSGYEGACSTLMPRLAGWLRQL